MATAARGRHDRDMKALAASVSWFLGAWVAYDMTAFAVGMPRQATPLVAVAAALVVWLGLRYGPVARSNGVFGARSDSSLNKATQPH
jgi:hypothetical protein